MRYKKEQLTRSMKPGATESVQIFPVSLEDVE